LLPTLKQTSYHACRKQIQNNKTEHRTRASNLATR
jgi:hypothetical protein